MTTMLRRLAALALVSSTLAVGGSSMRPARAEGPAPASTETAAAASQARPAIDPEATALLARSREYLGSLGAFRVHAQTTKDDIVAGDYKLQRTEVVDLVVRRPDKMRIDVKGDQRDQLIVNDGKTLTIFSRPEKYYATISALPTVEQTFDVADARYGVKVPLVDLMVMAAGEDFGSGVTRSRDIGPSRCGTVDCEHLAFRGKVDWQVWIEKGERPVPRKIVVTTRKEPTQPQFSAVLEWDTAPKIDDATFTFTPPPEATEMALPKPQIAPAK